MKKHFLTIIAAALLSMHSAFATAWVERSGLTSAQLQTEKEFWDDPPYDLRPTCISGYETAAGLRYAAVWEKASGSWRSLHGMTDTTFNDVNEYVAYENFHPVFISACASGGIRSYNAIWEPRATGESATLLGASLATLNAVQTVRLGQGYALTYVSAFTEDETPRYNAIWTRGMAGPPLEYMARFGLTVSQYNIQFSTWTGQGYRLTAHTVAFEGTEPRICAVFRKPFGVAWWSALGISEANYKGETWNAYYQGYRPSFVSVHRENGALRFNGIWTHNGGMTPNEIGPTEDVIRGYMERNNTAGVSVAVSRGGKLVYAKGFGMANKEAGEWMNPRHRLRIGSISKMVTAAGVIVQRQSGQLSSFDRTVFGPGSIFGNRFGTPPYSANEKLVSVRHLLNHTSGWTDNVPFNPDREAHISNFIDNFEVTKTPGSPDSYRYFNDDYVILGRVIEQLSNQNYEQYMKNSVLLPCGVTDMEIGATAPEDRKTREVVYYSNTGYPYGYDFPHGDSTGSWIAKPMDMLLFLRRFDGEAGKTDMITQALFNEKQMDPVGDGYGFGVILRPTWWGHDGGLAGTMAFVRHYPAEDLSIALICNEDCPENFGALVGNVAAALKAIPGAAWPDYDLFATTNTGFDTWTSSHFDATVRSQPGLKLDFWGPDANPDGDQFSNALEAGFGLNPAVWNPAPYKPSFVGNDFVLRWQRPVLASPWGVQIETEVSHYGQIWLPGPEVQIASGVINPTGFNTLEVRLPKGAHPRALLRLKGATN